MSCNFDLLGLTHKKLNLEFTELQFNVNQAFWEITSLPKLINVLFKKIVQTHIGDISKNYIFSVCEACKTFKCQSVLLLHTWLRQHSNFSKKKKKTHYHFMSDVHFWLLHRITLFLFSILHNDRCIFKVLSSLNKHFKKVSLPLSL